MGESSLNMIYRQAIYHGFRKSPIPSTLAPEARFFAEFILSGVGSNDNQQPLLSLTSRKDF